MSSNLKWIILYMHLLYLGQYEELICLEARAWGHVFKCYINSQPEWSIHKSQVFINIRVFRVFWGQRSLTEKCSWKSWEKFHQKLPQTDILEVSVNDWFMTELHTMLWNESSIFLNNSLFCVYHLFIPRRSSVLTK